MPLLRAIGAWFDRRVRDAEIYGTVAADGGMSQGAMVWVWFLIFIMALPLLAFLGLIGLIYEVIIRLDEGRLGKAIEWAVSSAVALLVVFGSIGFTSAPDLDSGAMFYVSRGNVPHTRHTQHRAPDGSLYAEELFGMEGFTGRSSLLYHRVPPTQTHRIEAVRDVKPALADDGVHRHRLVKTGDVPAKGNVVEARMPLFFNSDVLMGVVRPTENLPANLFYRNSEADEMLFVHTGEGIFESNFGPMRYGPGDYIVIPIGTTWRLAQDAGSDHRILYVESPSEIVPPKRYRNDWGQLLEHSPYSQRDIRVPDDVEVHDESDEFVVWVRQRSRITAYHYKHHPFDVVGWDGYLYPFIFNIGDYQPITGRVHQPPPVHQTFAGRNYVVCSFVPRKFDYHPLAIPAPYNHSNINSDEVIYYVAGNFMSRRGVDISSFTLHPAGIPHGPHPGTVEASIGKEATEELAVMIDTFHPLNMTPEAAKLEDDSYPYSWLPPENADADAQALSDRGPEAFPD